MLKKSETATPKEKPAYVVQLTNPAKRDLRKVARRDVGDIRDAIDDLAESPQGSSCRKLTNDPQGRWRKRVGDYRIVYHIDGKDRVVIVVIIQDRSVA